MLHLIRRVCGGPQLVGRRFEVGEAAVDAVEVGDETPEDAVKLRVPCHLDLPAPIEVLPNDLQGVVGLPVEGLKQVVSKKEDTFTNTKVCRTFLL